MADDARAKAIHDTIIDSPDLLVRILEPIELAGALTEPWDEVYWTTLSGVFDLLSKDALVRPAKAFIGKRPPDLGTL